MDWTTVYDISEVNYIWIDITCAVMCLFSAIIIFAEIQAVKYGEEVWSLKKFLTVLGCSILLLCGILVICWDGAIIKGASFNKYQVAYNEENYEYIIGYPEDMEWDNGAFIFQVDGTNFMCEMGYGSERNEKVVPFFENGCQTRVYYYAEEMFDDVNMQYMVLRIDVLTGDISTE